MSAKFLQILFLLFLLYDLSTPCMSLLKKLCVIKDQESAMAKKPVKIALDQEATLTLTRSKLLIDNIVSRPKARFYTGPNLTGESEDFKSGSVSDHQKCYQLEKIGGRVISMDLYETCLRIFKGPVKGCNGLSLAFYSKMDDDSQPGTRGISLQKFQISPDQEDTPQNVHWVGSCFQNELVKTEFLQLGNGATFKFRKLNPPVVPDLTHVGWSANWISTHSYPILHYRTGDEGRVEYIHAVIKSSHVVPSNTRMVTEEMWDYYSKLEKKQSDLLGRFLSPANFVVQESLGIYFQQIFPQSPTNRREQLERENEMVKYFREGGNKDKSVFIWINVDYQLTNSTRPTGFSYRIQYKSDGDAYFDHYLTNI